MRLLTISITDTSWLDCMCWTKSYVTGCYPVTCYLPPLKMTSNGLHLLPPYGDAYTVEETREARKKFCSAKPGDVVHRKTCILHFSTAGITLAKLAQHLLKHQQKNYKAFSFCRQHLLPLFPSMKYSVMYLFMNTISDLITVIWTQKFQSYIIYKG